MRSDLSVRDRERRILDKDMAKQEEVTVPIFTSLDPVYGGEGSQLQEAKSRFDALKSKFNQTFGASPELFARSPGTETLVSILFILLFCFFLAV